MAKKYLFIDIETTGLNPAKHEMLEIGAILTDGLADFAEISRFHALVRSAKPLTEWDPWSVEQHSKSGLLTRSLKGYSAQDAIVEFGKWAEDQVDKETTHFAGSSIHFDLSFIGAAMPFFNEWAESNVSHRRFDLSVFRMIDQLLGANFLPKNADTMPHTALEDIAFDIEQARRIRNIWQSMMPAMQNTKEPAASIEDSFGFRQSAGAAFHND